MKKLYIILLTFLIITTNVYSAGGSSGGSGGSGGDGADNKQSMFKSATNYVKAGKKLEKKVNLKKQKNMKKLLKDY